ncbi:MAG TPA: response regulator [Aggregatilineales bacterium]|nr:response regulator [Aggregatilineales bacterium]
MMTDLSYRQPVSANATEWTVLIVDDKPDNVNIVRTALRFQGATVLTASNGQEGLELLDNTKPSFILLDIAMPVMDGWRMLQHLRSNPATSDIPVIALTAHVMEGDRADFIKAGFDGHIGKPFDLFTLIPHIREALGLPRR